MAKRPTKAEREQARLDAELARRGLIAAAPDFSAASYSGGHSKQFAFLTSQSESLLGLCSRRAGKTSADMALLALTARATANITCLYIGLSEKQVRYTAFNRIWKPLLAKYKIECEHRDGDLVTNFPNGSVVQFGSGDDIRHIETFLGSSLAGGICIIDECQSMPDSVLEPLVERIITPALSDVTVEHPVAGRLVLTGTVPETASGYFWRLWTAEEKEWDRHNWNRFDNPFLINQRTQLLKALKRAGLKEDDPSIQRDWYGRFVFDRFATAYRYDSKLNSYTPALVTWNTKDFPPGKLLAVVPPPGVCFFATGMDPGSHDRFAITLIGWGRDSRDVWHIAEWSTPKKANATMSQAAAVMEELAAHYSKILRSYVDMGGSKVTLDTFSRDHRLPVQMAAPKGATKGQVDRVADLFAEKRLHVIAGSELETDLEKCRWDLDKREQGIWRWSGHHHGDVADSFRYALQAYTDISKPADPHANDSPEARAAHEREKEIKRLYTRPPADTNTQLDSFLGPRRMPGTRGW